ncbi:hypothetical protein BGZ73_009080 [Actinomortierella ambigua]|nr:hypothetical protein BGZ73_009080 [Actinomortierella ambigua]
MSQMFKDIELDTVRELLFRDKCILQGAKELVIHLHARLLSIDSKTIKFFLPTDDFVTWKTQHEQSIATKFVNARGEYTREGNGQTLLQDDIITYDDVYNEWYSVIARRVRGDKDPVVSSNRWMEFYEASNYFAYYDKEDRTLGMYFGFSTAWQLEQIHKHGWTLCLDGTHKIFGDTEAAMNLIEGFRAKWDSHAHLLDYLNSKYFGQGKPDTADADRVLQQRWMVCFRQEVSYCNIDANNFIESWHTALKSRFFGDQQQQQQQPDFVIDILSTVVLPHFHQKRIPSAAEVGQKTLAQEEETELTKIVRHHIDTRESRGYSGPSVTQTSETTLQVESFTDPRISYSVDTDFSKSCLGHITNCSSK